MRALLVEDKEDIVNFVRPALTAALFAVDVATDGDRGSYLARVNDYDVVILDLMLPKKTGEEALMEIRQSGKAVPVLILSVKSQTASKVDLLNAGADDYLSKPFSVEELMARVRALLRRPKQVESDILSLDDLLLDMRRHVVRRGKKEIYLTRKELMLLEYLMRNQGLVLSRAMIMEHVWDMDADPFSNTIESHILSLRRKIEPSGKKKLIHTIPGRGYKMEAR